MNLLKSLKDPSWRKALNEEFEKPYFKELERQLSRAYDEHTVYPDKGHVFSALNLVSFEDVKVVILGQDPYHGPGQAHGLSFSVQKGVRIPPSLLNIFKELESDLGIEKPKHGFLESWAKEGILLLNNQLTVIEGRPMSHKDIGWDQFTQKIIELLNQERKNIVFILWGTPAQKKANFVDNKKHHIIKSVHPSPLSAHRGFFGSKPFSQANTYLKSKGIPEINWRIN
jgi:uracil-DNA glycosylase